MRIAIFPGRGGALQRAVEVELDLGHADVVRRARGDAGRAADGRAVCRRGIDTVGGVVSAAVVNVRSLLATELPLASVECTR